MMQKSESRMLLTKDDILLGTQGLKKELRE